MAAPDRAHLPGPFCITWSQIGRLAGSRASRSGVAATPRVFARGRRVRASRCPNLSAQLGPGGAPKSGEVDSALPATLVDLGRAEFHLAPGGNPVQTNFAHRNQKWRVSRSIGPAGSPEPVETGTEDCRRGHGLFTIGRGTRREGCPLAVFIMWVMRGMMPEIARCGFGGPAFRFDSTKRLRAKAALLRCPRHQFECQLG